MPIRKNRPKRTGRALAGRAFVLRIEPPPFGVSSLRASIARGEKESAHGFGRRRFRR